MRSDQELNDMEAVAAADRYTGAMNNAVQAITWQGLVLASIPTFFVLLLMWRWAAGAGTALYATARMLVQLLLIGYVLVYIFEAGEASIIMAV
ncbi:MAG: ABC transporter permease, partial [Gammaproteobacteria bacterium]|nr:ABC transporter permease [Gammaproteobacteria bacterium]